jgi:hypothetical protein
MQNPPTFMPAEPTHIEIEVKVNQDDHTFQTNLFCDLNQCGRFVTIVSDGPKTAQNVRCAVHGLLASFPDQIAFREFVRFFANKILAVHRHELIEAEAMCILGDSQTAPESMN